MNKNRRVKIIGSILVLCILCLIVRFYPEPSNSELVLYGNVDIRDVVLSFRVPGRIDAMLVDEGDLVLPGQVIARLVQDTYLLDLSKAQADLTLAKAEEHNALVQYRRRSSLIKTGAVSQALYDDSIALKEETRAQVAIAQAMVDKARIALNDTELRAPSRGRVLTRVREPGAVVLVSDPVYSVLVEKPVWVRTYIDEPSLGLIHPGQTVLIYTDSKPNKPYTGHVGYISSQAEFTPKNVETTELRTALVYRLRIVVDESHSGLRQGMPVTIKIGLKTSNEPIKH